ncbi:MAG: hypothetical protein Q7Q71_00210 [Verrucomicrobiota bacterium JB023]|nr:hypothetical protein [Verrucomicrobiota bacterium JB023]
MKTDSPQALDRFISGLVKIAKPGSLLSRYQLGFGLVYRQFKKLKARIKTVNLPVSGFREDLHAHGQGGEMFRHLYWHMGCSLMGWLGGAISWATHRMDVKQMESGRAESTSEVLDNLAGRACGRALRSYLKGKLNETQLRDELRRILSS